MTRPKKPGREHWPTGLWQSRPGYFVWAHPSGGGAFAIGRVTEEHAIKQAGILALPFAPLPELRGGKLQTAAALVYSRAFSRRHAHESDFLTKEEFAAIWKRAAGRCELSGIALSLHGKEDGWQKHPWAPSLDRIDSRKGYVAGNCRIVCVAVNIALNEFGEEVLRRLAMAIVKGCDLTDMR